MTRTYTFAGVFACTLMILLSIHGPLFGQSFTEITLLPGKSVTDEQPVSIVLTVGASVSAGIAEAPVVTFSRDTITIALCYFQSELAQPWQFSDTVIIGALPPGKYTLVGKISERLYSGTDSVACREKSHVLVDSFSVTEAPARPLNADIVVYPNPSSGGWHLHS